MRCGCAVSVSVHLLVLLFAEKGSKSSPGCIATTYCPPCCPIPEKVPLQRPHRRLGPSPDPFSLSLARLRLRETSFVCPVLPCPALPFANGTLLAQHPTTAPTGAMVRNIVVLGGSSHPQLTECAPPLRRLHCHEHCNDEAKRKANEGAGPSATTSAFHPQRSSSASSRSGRPGWRLKRACEGRMSSSSSRAAVQVRSYHMKEE
jgi:hypothetical protein